MNLPILKNNFLFGALFFLIFYPAPLWAQLNIVKTANPVLPDVGETTFYTIVVSNEGTDPFEEIVVTDELPDGVEFIQATEGLCNFDGGSKTVTCPLGNLNAGQEITVTIVVVPLAPGSIGNTATVGAKDFTPVPGGGTSTFGIVVVGTTNSASCALKKR